MKSKGVFYYNSIREPANPLRKGGISYTTSGFGAKLGWWVETYTTYWIVKKLEDVTGIRLSRMNKSYSERWYSRYTFTFLHPSMRPFNASISIVGDESDREFPQLKKLSIVVSQVTVDFSCFSVEPQTGMMEQRAGSEQEAIELAKQEAELVWSRYGNEIKRVFIGLISAFNYVSRIPALVRRTFAEKMEDSLHKSLRWLLFYPQSEIKAESFLQSSLGQYRSVNNGVSLYSTSTVARYYFKPPFLPEDDHFTIYVVLFSEFTIIPPPPQAHQVKLKLEASVSGKNLTDYTRWEEIAIQFDLSDDEIKRVAEGLVDVAAKMINDIFIANFGSHYNQYVYFERTINSTKRLPNKKDCALYVFGGIMRFIFELFGNYIELNLPRFEYVKYPGVSVGFSDIGETRVYESVFVGKWELKLQGISTPVVLPELKIHMEVASHEQRLLVVRKLYISNPIAQTEVQLSKERVIASGVELQQFLDELINKIANDPKCRSIVSAYFTYLLSRIADLQNGPY